MTKAGDRILASIEAARAAARDGRLFAYSVAWSEKDGEFVGTCAEFPSLSWLAPERDAALAGIKQLVREVLDDIDASGEAAPTAFASNT